MLQTFELLSFIFRLGNCYTYCPRQIVQGNRGPGIFNARKNPTKLESFCSTNPFLHLWKWSTQGGFLFIFKNDIHITWHMKCYKYWTEWLCMYYTSKFEVHWILCFFAEPIGTLMHLLLWCCFCALLAL